MERLRLFYMYVPNEEDANDYSAFVEANNVSEAGELAYEDHFKQLEGPCDCPYDEDNFDEVIHIEEVSIHLAKSIFVELDIKEEDEEGNVVVKRDNLYSLMLGHPNVLAH